MRWRLFFQMVVLLLMAGVIFYFVGELELGERSLEPRITTHTPEELPQELKVPNSKSRITEEVPENNQILVRYPSSIEVLGVRIVYNDIFEMHEIKFRLKNKGETELYMLFPTLEYFFDGKWIDAKTTTAIGADVPPGEIGSFSAAIPGYHSGYGVIVRIKPKFKSN